MVVIIVTVNFYMLYCKGSWLTNVPKLWNTCIYIQSEMQIICIE